MTAVVLTCLLTAEKDPQRDRRWSPDPAVLDVLRRSVAAHDRHLVVLHDELAEPDAAGTTFARVPPGGNPYWVRWAHYAEYMANHPEIAWAWCVDGTDTQMLNDPFGRMRPGILYVGSEERTIDHPKSGKWLRRGATDDVRAWLDEHPKLPVLNMGVLGGDRATVMEVAATLAERAGESDWEIGAFQQIGYEQFAGRLVTGPMVHTPFLGNVTESFAWWRHK